MSFTQILIRVLLTFLRKYLRIFSYSFASTYKKFMCNSVSHNCAHSFSLLWEEYCAIFFIHFSSNAHKFWLKVSDTFVILSAKIFISVSQRALTVEFLKVEKIKFVAWIKSSSWTRYYITVPIFDAFGVEILWIRKAFTSIKNKMLIWMVKNVMFSYIYF